ncbi:plasmid mobilization relaxosome protein MobC [Paracoccus sp. SSK6]|uniref:plasmid mobilization protein n=1 Tax=Paracoccus sp. SSK6 TaxID=3143131 RepID=UPI00321949CC
MARRKSSDPRRIFHIRLSNAEYADIERKAQDAGVTMADLMRTACREAIVVSQINTKVNAGELRRQNYLLATIGNNLNQLARHVNTHKRDADILTITLHLRVIARDIKRAFSLDGELIDERGRS